MKAEMKTNTIWSNAKDCLKRYYWNGFGVALVFSAITSAVESVTGSVGDTVAMLTGGMNSVSLENYGSTTVPAETTVTMESWSSVIFGVALTIAASVFIGFLANVGQSRFFSAARVISSDFGSAFVPFKRYKESLPMALRYALYANQWSIYTLPVLLAASIIFNSNPSLGSAIASIGSMVLAIGTLVVSLKLFCVPYIYAENPEIDPKRAIELSFKMTEGYRGKIFGNFILCGLLALAGVCCCGVGVLFAMPMIQAVNAEMYAFLSDIAKANGITDEAELPGYIPAQAREASDAYTPVEVVVGVPVQKETVYTNDIEE